MTEQQQLTAIAAACGWSTCTTPEGIVYALHWFDPTEGCEIETTPLHDLNACHEMEKALSTRQQREYANRLHEPHMPAKRHYLHVDFGVLHTTASQRCEAFLRTLNLWKD